MSHVGCFCPDCLGTAEQQLPLPIVTEQNLSDSEGVLLFGRPYQAMLRKARRGRFSSTGVSDTRTLVWNSILKSSISD